MGWETKSQGRAQPPNGHDSGSSNPGSSTIERTMPGQTATLPGAGFPERNGTPANEGRGGRRAVRLCHGRVRWFDDRRGFGFIDAAGGRAEVFVHQSAIRAEGYRSLIQGQLVQFELRTTRKGYQADAVMPVSSGPNGEHRAPPSRSNGHLRAGAAFDRGLGEDGLPDEACLSEQLL